MIKNKGEFFVGVICAAIVLSAVGAVAINLHGLYDRSTNAANSICSYAYTLPRDTTVFSGQVKRAEIDHGVGYVSVVKDGLRLTVYTDTAMVVCPEK